VRHELAWLVAVSQGVWLLASPQLWPTRASSIVVGLALAAVVATWVVLLGAQVVGGPRMRVRAGWMDAAVLLAAALVLGLQATDTDAWIDAASLAVLACAAAAVLLPGRLAATAVAAGVLLTAPGTVEYLPPIGLAGLPAPFVPVYVLLAGAGLLVVREGLERAAADRDEAASRRDHAERRAAVAAGVERELHQRERLLHETVLNTLTAIARGGLSQGPAIELALRDRCREAADVLRGLMQADAPRPETAPEPGTGYVGLGPDLDAYVAGLRVSGLEVEMAVDSMATVPASVRRGLVTAIRESLANVARHARAHRARVQVRVVEQDGIVVRAQVQDDGIGFDPARTEGRFGLSGAIVGPMEEVGGTARVESAPGAGTRVYLEWQQPMNAVPADERWPATPALVAPGVILGLYVAATVLVAWLQYDHPVVSVTDLSLIVVLATVVALAAPEAPLPWPLVVTVSALAPLLTLLERSGGAGLAVGDGWLEAAVAGLFMVTAAIGPRLGWLLLVLAWVVGSGDLGVALSPATALILGGAVFGRSLRRDAWMLVRQRREAVGAESRLAIARESVDRVKARYDGLEESAAIGLLDGIMAGVIDPDDPAVREQAGLEESFLRNMMRVDPTADAVRAMVARLAASAHRRGTHLRIDLAVPPGVRVAVPGGLAESLLAAVASSQVGSTARLTVRGGAGGVDLSLLVTIDAGERARMPDLEHPGVPSDPLDPADCDVIWEARLLPEAPE
jgi:signal transduction histidine kinase